MPPQRQVVKQQETEKAEVPVRVQGGLIEISVPLPAPHTRATIFPGDDLEALVPATECPELNALLSRLRPGSNKDIDHIGLSSRKQRKETQVSLQLSAENSPQGALGRVMAILTECGGFKPVFRSKF